MEIFNEWGEPNGGLYMLSKYGHVLFGITWIGLLYFFNVVQVPSFAEMSAEPGERLLREEVTAEDIAKVVSSWTGVPVTRMLQTEKEKLLTMFLKLLLLWDVNS